MNNKTTMSVRDFVIIYNLVEAEMREIKSSCWLRTRNYYPSILSQKDFEGHAEIDAEIDAKVKEQLDNNMRYQELLSIINRLNSMTIDVNVPDVEIEDKTDNLTRLNLMKKEK